MRARDTLTGIGDRERISVIIPIHNAASYIAACVESILAQGDAAIEIILVNDGSTDGSDAICRRLAERFSIIRYIVQENAGVSAARNAGLDAAIGEWILFVDADDLLLPGALSTIRQNMTDRYAMVYYNYRQTLEADIGIWSGGTVVAAAQDIVTASLDYMGALQRYGQRINLQHNYLTSCWAILYRADLVQGIRFQERLRLSEDLCYNLDCLRCCDEVLLLNTPVYYYRSNEESATHCYTVAQMEQRYAAYDHLLLMDLTGKEQAAARSKYIARGLLQTLEHLNWTEDPGCSRTAYRAYVQEARIRAVLRTVNRRQLSEGQMQNLYYGWALALLQRGHYAGALALGQLYARLRRNR